MATSVHGAGPLFDNLLERQVPGPRSRRKRSDIGYVTALLGVVGTGEVVDVASLGLVVKQLAGGNVGARVAVCRYGAGGVDVQRCTAAVNAAA